MFSTSFRCTAKSGRWRKPSRATPPSPAAPAPPQERAAFFDAFVSQPFQKVYQRFFAISDLSYGVANGGRLRKLLGRLKSGKKEKKS